MIFVLVRKCGYVYIQTSNTSYLVNVLFTKEYKLVMFWNCFSADTDFDLWLSIILVGRGWSWVCHPNIESATTLSDFEDITNISRFGYFGNGHSGTAQCVGIGITR